MANSDLKAKLETLLELLLEEREKTKALDMPGLQKVVEKKQALLETIHPLPEEADELKALVQAVDRENRRNAFLLWTGLNWVRDLMGFFGKAAMPQVYGDSGKSRVLAQGGRLLSGKV